MSSNYIHAMVFIYCDPIIFKLKILVFSLWSSVLDTRAEKDADTYIIYIYIP